MWQLVVAIDVKSHGSAKRPMAKDQGRVIRAIAPKNHGMDLVAHLGSFVFAFCARDKQETHSIDR